MSTAAVSAPTTRTIPTTPTGPRRHDPRTVLVGFVCMAERPDWYTVSERLNDLAGYSTAGLAPVYRAHRWTRRERLINPTRQGRHWYAAGGRVGSLRLDRIRAQAGRNADYEWRTWAQVTAGTPRACTKDEIAQANPRANEQTITTLFEHQPRVAAMLEYNARPFVPVKLAPDNLDVFQAGCGKYWRFQVMSSVVGDEMCSLMGDFWFPQSDSLADRFAYLTKANHHLDCMGPGSWLVCARL